PGYPEGAVADGCRHEWVPRRSEAFMLSSISSPGRVTFRKRRESPQSSKRATPGASILLRLALLFVFLLSGIAVGPSKALAADTPPPFVFIVPPASGGTYTSAQTITFVAAASDNVGVTGVEFYDGATLKSTVTVSPYMYAWTFTAADNGLHSWTAKAYDAAG